MSTSFKILTLHGKPLIAISSYKPTQLSWKEATKAAEKEAKRIFRDYRCDTTSEMNRQDFKTHLILKLREWERFTSPTDLAFWEDVPSAEISE